MKKLPKYNTVNYATTLPISKKNVKFRAYTTADERLLIAANASIDSNPQDYVNNVLQVIEDIVTEKDGAVISKLPAIDVRYLLLQQRSKSVGNIIEFKYKDKKCRINIDEIKVNGERSKNDYIYDVGGGFKVKLKELSFEDEINHAYKASEIKKKSGNDAELSEDDPVAIIIKSEIFHNMIYDSVESIFTDDDAWIVGSDITKEDVKDWFDTIPGDYLRKIFNFFDNPPFLEATYEQEKGGAGILTSKEVDFLSLEQIT